MGKKDEKKKRNGEKGEKYMREIASADRKKSSQTKMAKIMQENGMKWAKLNKNGAEVGAKNRLGSARYNSC